ncbi:MAG: hypothetical protein HQM11_06900 [SAR324 cluster bacterium]|nr:hypothetical protein [SAR324 cluster bacterium]
MIRLQGTDGIRGKIGKSIDYMGVSPQDLYLNKGILTETFFELYVYSYCKYLISQKFIKNNNKIVIGWDTRDKEGHFNASAVNGILKAGLDAIVVGISPTPAVVLYMINIEASSSIVLTASHNPPDQNGIKIFAGHTALKLLPKDDINLSKIVLDTSYDEIKNLELLGKIENHEIISNKIFNDYTLNEPNFWDKKNILLNNSILVIDAANGAYSPSITNIFNQIGDNVVITNNDITAAINYKSGVADFEGLGIIDWNMACNDYAEYSTIKKMFELGNINRDRFKHFNETLYCTIFDGDGDRCFILVYEPFDNKLLVLSGDKLSFIQAQYLLENNRDSKETIYINTVESDIETIRNIKQTGFKTVQTAVGDKWILWEIFIHNWSFQKEYLLNIFSNKNIHSEIFEIIGKIDVLLDSMSLSHEYESLPISQLYYELDVLLLRSGNQSLSSVYPTLSSVIGAEESGHVITSGYLNNQRVFIGNGLKSGLNSLVSIEYFKTKMSIQNFYQWLENPFSVGYHISQPVYYVNKSLLIPNSDFTKNMESTFGQILQKYFPEQNIRNIFRSEEPEMLFFEIEDNSIPLATVFIRNSGTEDKMSLYVRGSYKIKETLDKIADELYKIVFFIVKDFNKDIVLDEMNVIQQIHSLMTDISVRFVSLDRLFNEMKKQKLIFFHNNQIKLSQMGYEYLNFINNSERSE